VPSYPDQPRSLDCCPNCNVVFEIAAVDLSIVSGNIVLFVCPTCGLTKAESRTEARRKIRLRIAELGRLLRRLRTQTMRVRRAAGNHAVSLVHPDQDR
jgi:hypothetical protein